MTPTQQFVALIARMTLDKPHEDDSQALSALIRRARALQQEPAPVVKVRVSGGVVQNVEAPDGITVQVYDYDVGDSDPVDLDEDESGDDCNFATYGGAP